MSDFKIDPTTGIYEIPDRYFWRVRQGALSIYYIELRKRVGPFSRRIDQRVLHYYDKYHNVLDPTEEVLDRAYQIMQEFHDPWGIVFGDYPPRKLGENA